jgi:hypothetical protein
MRAAVARGRRLLIHSRPMPEQKTLEPEPGQSAPAAPGEHAAAEPAADEQGAREHAADEHA